MNILELDRKTLKRMKKIELEIGNINTEGNLYIFEQKDKWEKELKVYKELYYDMGHIFSNKLFTLNELIDNKDQIDVEEIVLPEKLAVIGDRVEGFVMPYIPNTNFYSVLNDKEVATTDKIKYFKEISNILKKMDYIRGNQITDFYLNDLHEGNFILNKITGKINVVDMDSCKINGNKPFVSKYLTPLSPIADMPNKYKVNEEEMYPGYIVSDRNSDLYCYTVMVLNFLYKDRITRLSREGYFLYLEYLIHIGLSFEFVSKMAKIYEYADNENIGDYLNSIDDNILRKSRKEVFLRQ